MSHLSTILAQIRETLVETGAFADWEFDLTNTGLGKIQPKLDDAIEIAEHYEVRVCPSQVEPASHRLQ